LEKFMNKLKIDHFISSKINRFDPIMEISSEAQVQFLI
jgi:hypothetical protein